MKYTVSGRFFGMDERWEETADDERELAFVINGAKDNGNDIDIKVTDEDGEEIDTEEVDKIIQAAEAWRPTKLQSILDLLDDDVQIDLTVSVYGQAADEATGTKNDDAITEYAECGVDSMNVVDNTLVITVVDTYDD